MTTRAQRTLIYDRPGEFSVSGEFPAGIHLWDVIDECWTPPREQAGYNRETAQQLLAKLVYRCSGCHETSSGLVHNVIAKHVAAVFEKAASHGKAEVAFSQLNDGSDMARCTVCGFKSYKGEAAIRRHIDQILLAPATHKGATEVCVNRFALQPSAASEKVVQARPVITKYPEAIIRKQSEKYIEGEISLEEYLAMFEREKIARQDAHPSGGENGVAPRQRRRRRRHRRGRANGNG